MPIRINRERESRLTHKKLRLLFDYNQETGRLIWKARSAADFPDMQRIQTWNTRYAGKAAGSISKKHLNVDIFGEPYYVHRVVWAWHYGSWPLGEIDHINGDGFDNRIANLRDVSPSENRRNARRPIRNTSGIVGVYWDADKGKWNAQIKFGGQTKHLGVFDSKQEAGKARKKAEQLLGFHPNHGRAA